MSLSKNLKYLRKKHKYNQEDIAEKLGYKSYTTVQKWESGVSEPPVKILREIAELYDVSLTNLTDIDLTNNSPLPVINDIDLSNERFSILGEDIKDLSEDELKEILNFIKFVKSKR